jgi:hypothetical protein
VQEVGHSLLQLREHRNGMGALTATGRATATRRAAAAAAATAPVGALTNYKPGKGDKTGCHGECTSAHARLVQASFPP